MYIHVLKWFVFLFLFNISAVLADKIEKFLPNFETYIQKSMQEWGAPAVAVGIVKDGKVIYQKAFGTQVVDKQQLVNEHTVFQIASLSKNFLATLLAQLVDEGKISWDDPVRKYIPDFFVGNEEVSKIFLIRDLVSHRSGLKPFSGDTLWNLGFSQSEIQKGISKLPLVTAFRQSYGYQNHLFGLASLIAEKVTGRTIKELLKERFFQPLNMADTNVGEEIFLKAASQTWWGKIKGLVSKEEINIAMPHHVINGKVCPLPFTKYMYTFPGSTGVNTSLADMTKWMLFHLNKTLIKDNPTISLENQKVMQTAHVTAQGLKPEDMQFPGSRVRHIQYGIGWFLYEYGHGEKWVKIQGHMGGFAGVRSLMILIPAENLGIVILSNFGAMRVSMLPEALRAKFLDLYMDLPEQDWSKENFERMQDIRNRNKQFKASQRLQHPQPSAPLEKYVGDYKNDLYGSVKIIQENGQLFMEYRERKVPLKHWNGSEFSFNGYDLSSVYSDYDLGYIEFGFQGEKAQLCAINLLNEGVDDLFKRVS